MQRVELTDLERKKLSEAGRQSMKTIGWLPIEMAPKDGTEILAYVNNNGQRGERMVLYWDRGFWLWGALAIHDPTHWMPLPEPPKREDK